MSSWKLGEWRDGQKYEVVRGEHAWSHGCGRVTRSRYEKGVRIEETTVLFTFQGDGQDSDLFDAFQSGFTKGEKAGREALQKELRKLLGA